MNGIIMKAQGSDILHIKTAFLLVVFNTLAISFSGCTGS
jgi:hypothetical protein